MTLLIPNVAETAFLDLIAARSLSVGLYTALADSGGGANVRTDAMTLTDITAATFSGYALDAITPTTGWTVAPGAPSTMTATAASVFTADNGIAGQEDILGYYVVDTVANEIRWVEPAVATIPIVNDGDFLSVTAQLTFADTQD